jgi:hypothetical protein
MYTEKNMKKKYKTILYYLGVVAGALVILYNYNVVINLDNINFSSADAYIIYTIIKRSVELAVVVGVCKAMQYNISGVVLLILAGGITGGCISRETLKSSNSGILNSSILTSGISHMFLYSMIVTSIVILYYIIAKIFVADKGCDKDSLYARLHGSIRGYALIITILLINILLEVKILKFF